MDKHKKYMIMGALFLLFLLGVCFYISGIKEKPVMAKAEESKKEFKWTKTAMEEGTTVDAAYLWPDETDPSFTAVYMNGDLLEEDAMVTVTSGNIYHFRGVSEESVLYTEVYTDGAPSAETVSGKADAWYQLLPLTLRNNFEQDGWAWGLDNIYERAYLDAENKYLTVKNGDDTAVLYGIGLYLDNKYNYREEDAFLQEGMVFTSVFGESNNLFASALECYYVKGGELRTKCPGIYAEIDHILLEFSAGISQ